MCWSGKCLQSSSTTDQKEYEYKKKKKTVPTQRTKNHNLCLENMKSTQFSSLRRKKGEKKRHGGMERSNSASECNIFLRFFATFFRHRCFHTTKTSYFSQLEMFIFSNLKLSLGKNSVPAGEWIEPKRTISFAKCSEIYSNRIKTFHSRTIHKSVCDTLGSIRSATKLKYLNAIRSQGP